MSARRLMYLYITFCILEHELHLSLNITETFFGMSLNGLDLNGQQTSSNHPIYIGKGTENARITDDGAPNLSSQPQLQPSKDANDPLNWADHK